MEVIGDQEKVLQDTRDVFDKTVAHFAIETSVSFESHVNYSLTPQHNCNINGNLLTYIVYLESVKSVVALSLIIYFNLIAKTC